MIYYSFIKLKQKKVNKLSGYTSVTVTLRLRYVSATVSLCLRNGFGYGTRKLKFR